jgi:tetratricopeptide (TPR) repeat protein
MDLAGLMDRFAGAVGRGEEMMKSQSKMMIAGLVVLAGVLAAGPALAQIGAGNTVFVELARPQCDDLGHYVPVIQDGVASVIGFASARGGVVSVTVNDVQAELFEANYTPMNTPDGYGSVGFRVPLVLYPDSVLVVKATGAGGDGATAVFQPDEYATLSRLQALGQQSGEDAYYSLRLGNAYASQGDYETAYPYYHRCTGLQPDFFLGAYFLGLALYDDNRDDDAIGQFRHCADVQPTFYLAQYDMGRCLDRSGRYDDAIAEYRLVIGRRPQFVEAHWRLGETYSHRGDWDNAGTEYRTALRYNPNFAPAHHGLGAVLAQQQNWDGAADELRAATKISPWNAQARADLASTLAHKRDWTEATKQYKQAVRISPQSGGAQQGLAETQFATGKYGQAWDSVHAGQQAGVQPDPAFVRQLRSKMAEPTVKPVVTAPRVAPVQPRLLPVQPQIDKPRTVPVYKPPSEPATTSPRTVQGQQGHKATTAPVAKPLIVPTYKPPSEPTATKPTNIQGHKPATAPTTKPLIVPTYKPPSEPAVKPATGNGRKTITVPTTKPTADKAGQPQASRGQSDKTKTGQGQKPGGNKTNQEAVTTSSQTHN